MRNEVSEGGRRKEEKRKGGRGAKVKRERESYFLDGVVYDAMVPHAVCVSWLRVRKHRRLNIIV